LFAAALAKESFYDVQHDYVVLIAFHDLLSPLWPPAVRRRFELEALVGGAGPVAEGL
jgi:hypothetical protein